MVAALQLYRFVKTHHTIYLKRVKVDICKLYLNKFEFLKSRGKKQMQEDHTFSLRSDKFKITLKLPIGDIIQ